MHHHVEPDGHLPRCEDPHHWVCRRDQSMLISNHWIRGNGTSRPWSTPMSTWGCITHMSQTTDLKGVQMAKTHGQSAINVGQLPIFVDGASAPLVTSKVTSKTLSKSLEMTRVQDTAFACDSFSGRIALATTMWIRH
jgi:hypothetical protein